MKDYCKDLTAIGLIVLICLSIGFHLGKASTTPIPAPHSPPTAITAELWRITAYCPKKCCCGKFADGITASGAPAKGKLIAAPKSIPFGTWIEVEGYGYAEVLDRGGAIKGRRLDVLFTDDEILGLTGHEKALEWGVKYISIKKTW